MLINKIAFCPRKGYASGTGETYWDFAGRLKHNMLCIKTALNQRRYRFDLCLKRTKRAKGRVRDLYISTWGDRIVERWLNDCLNLLLTGWFSSNSYAYRITELGLDSCQHRVLRALKQATSRGGPYIIKRDVTRFFYTIDQDLLLQKIAELVDTNDYLYQLLEQRIKFSYHTGDFAPCQSTIGIPFGSPLACSLANIFLTDLDKSLGQHPVRYFRYADDFLIIATTATTAQAAATTLDDSLTQLKLSSKDTHKLDVAFRSTPGFTTIHKFKYLGIEFNTKNVRLPIEKQRKLLNLYRREFNRYQNQLMRLGFKERLVQAIAIANTVITDRIRSVAIIDYYLKHINDEAQLKQLDLLIAQLVISTVLNKPFRQRDFKTVPYKLLRTKGLISLRHRHKLHTHGHLHINFLSLHNDIIQERYHARQQRFAHVFLDCR